MNKVLENSLFQINPDRFQKLRRYVGEFNTSYNGNNIIQDDIFNIVRNYAKRNGKHIELFRLPVYDEDFCAFTCVREGKIFTVINSYLPICKQIFAAGHELYHIWRYVSDSDDSLPLSGSFLTADNMDEETAKNEDNEANAFSALLLAPKSAITEQIEIYDLGQKEFDLDDVIRLMDVFAIPFKAMVLRLYEEKIIDAKRADYLLEKGSVENQKHSMRRQNTALRWQKRTEDIADIGTLHSLIQDNMEAGCLPKQRIEEDIQFLEDNNIWDFEE